MKVGGFRPAAAAAAVALVLAGAQPALAATVTGQIVMGTEGSGLPSNPQVMVLKNPENPQQQEQPTPAAVAADGSFSFEADEDASYAVGMFHDSVAYSSLIPAGATEPVELTIFDTTDDDSVVRVASDSLTVVKGADDRGSVLEILQLLRVENVSDRTFVGSGEGESRRVLTLPVAESAFDLAPADQTNPAGLANEGGEVVTTAPLRPGVTSIAYLYRVEVPRSGWQLRREVLRPTARADLLIGSGLVFDAGPGFAFEEETELGGQTYRRYRRENLSPGTALAADIVFPGESTTGLWVGAGIAAALLAAALGAGEALRRKRKAAAAAARQARQHPSAQTTGRAELIEQIARLDEEHAAGEVSDDEHQSRRELLLARVDRTSAASGRSEPSEPE
ncbi:MAG: hypothetical protein WD602_10885 [Actinomycetota bacterium]